MSIFRSGLRFIGVVFVAMLVQFALHRGIELGASSDLINEKTGGGDILSCFARGLAFDLHCASEIVLLPLVALIVMRLAGKFPKWAMKAIVILAMVEAFVMFSFCYANVPYVGYQMSNLGKQAIGAFFGGTEVMGMMVSAQYMLFFLLGLAMSALACVAIWFIGKKTLVSKNIVGGGKTELFVGIGVLSILCLFLRGRMTTEENMVAGEPLNEMYAECTADPLVNLVCVNPWFAIEKSLMRDAVVPKDENPYKYMTDEEAKAIATAHCNYPACVPEDAVERHPHVFFVMMESLSAHAMEAFGNKNKLTPFLDSLYKVSYSFSNVFSAGMQTHYAMFAATVAKYSIPGDRMLEYKQNAKDYIFTPMKERGYYCNMYVAHGKSFDKIDEFYNVPSLDRLYSLEDYGEENRAGAWGVNDGFLFDYVYDRSEEHAKADKSPIFSFILTCSNHPDFFLPKEYMGKHGTPREDAVAYSDAMLRRFYNKVRSTEWGKDAMFVIFGDHGYVLGVPETVSDCCLNHIPLIINAPGIIENKINATFGTEADVMPTMLSMLGIKYNDYRGVGADLLHTNRDTVYYTNGAVSIGRIEGKVFLFNPSMGGKVGFEMQKDCKMKMMENRDDDAMERFLKGCLQYTYNDITGQ